MSENNTKKEKLEKTVEKEESSSEQHFECYVCQKVFALFLKVENPLQNFQNKLLNLAIKNLHKCIDGML